MNFLLKALAVNGEVMTSNIPSSAPNLIIVFFYRYVFFIIGGLALLVLLYWAIKNMISGGNASEKSDAKSGIKNVLYAILMLAGAYIILATINPDLNLLQLPFLNPLPQGSGDIGEVTCTGRQCATSPATAAVLKCVNQKANVAATTYQGSHSNNSCHFGGRTCNDGAHAIDWGKNSLAASNLTLVQIKGIAESCASGEVVQCRCETPEGKTLDPNCTNPKSNHVHCNVFEVGQSCGCN